MGGWGGAVSLCDKEAVGIKSGDDRTTHRTTHRTDSMTPKSALTGDYSMSFVLPEFKTQSCFSESGSPHHRQPFPLSSEVTLLPGRDQTSFQQQSHLFCFVFMTHLAQSDFAQEMKTVQSGLDSWGLRGTERKQLAETLRVPGARDKVPPEPAPAMSLGTQRALPRK